MAAPAAKQMSNASIGSTNAMPRDRVHSRMLAPRQALLQCKGPQSTIIGRNVLADHAHSVAVRAHSVENPPSGELIYRRSARISPKAQ